MKIFLIIFITIIIRWCSAGPVALPFSNELNSTSVAIESNESKEETESNPLETDNNTNNNNNDNHNPADDVELIQSEDPSILNDDNNNNNKGMSEQFCVYFGGCGNGGFYVPQYYNGCASGGCGGGGGGVGVGFGSVGNYGGFIGYQAPAYYYPQYYGGGVIGGIGGGSGCVGCSTGACGYGSCGSTVGSSGYYNAFQQTAVNVNTFGYGK